jgi:hypothetical protein
MTVRRGLLQNLSVNFHQFFVEFLPTKCTCNHKINLSELGLVVVHVLCLLKQISKVF